MSSFFGRVDLREAPAQRGDDVSGLVHRKCRLGEVGELRVGAERERVDVRDGLDQNGRLGRFADRPDDLLVTGMADEDDRVAGRRIPLGLDVHLCHERARRVDRRELPRCRVRAHRRGDAVRREDDRLALRDVVLVLDEHGAARLEVADDVQVVHDLLADVDRRAVQAERLLDRLDRPFDAGAVAAG